MTRTARRGLEAVVGVVALTGAVVWLSGGCEERVAPGEVEVAGLEAEGRPVVVVEVSEPAVEWASGEVASARHTSVASRVLARIESVRVRAGSTVAEGDVLVVLDARDLSARVGEAEESLRASEARLELAERDHARARELVRTGVAPERRLDEALSEVRAVRAEVAGRREALDEARTAASFAEIRAPVTGRVVDRLAEPGDTAVPGRPLLRIYDPTLLRVEAPVRESLAVQLQVGDPLRVEVPALGEPVEGRIDEIVPFAEPGARTLLVKVTLPRSDARLFAGLYARIAIPAGARRRLLVPAAAVERVGQLEFVTVIEEQDAPVRRLVTTGEAAGEDRVEILSGLRPGERVLLAEEVEATGAGARPPEAAEAVARLREQLGAALRRALEEEGAESAIGVCRSEAPRIAGEVASQRVAVGRTSHRLRNPENAPEDWMLPLLEEYRQGEPRPKRSGAQSFRVVDLGERGTGYVEPIYLQPLCATCHGTGVSPALLERIRELYPEDEATGFEVGELRGLFWAVVRPAAEAEGGATRDAVSGVRTSGSTR